MVVAIFSFIIRAYNMPNETYEKCKEYLAQSRPRLTFKKLHQLMYLFFMIAFCAK